MPPAVTNQVAATTTTVAPVPPPETSAPTEYIIAAGDNFSTLAKKFHVTTRALVDANPGVEPTRLQIGQKIHIPSPPPTAVTGNGTAAPATDAANGDTIYTVKSGDTLTGIALSHHVTVRALRAENDLKTDSIKVGQKLKIPKATLPPDSGATLTSAPPASSTPR
jgi:lysozyme